MIIINFLRYDKFIKRRDLIPKYALKYLSSCTDYDDDAGNAKDNRYPIIIRYQKFMYPRKDASPNYLFQAHK